MRHPQKIMIFGRPGSGKSTFALQLHKLTEIPLHHVDKHFFEAGWQKRAILIHPLSRLTQIKTMLRC